MSFSRGGERGGYHSRGRGGEGGFRGRGDDGRRFRGGRGGGDGGYRGGRGGDDGGFRGGYDGGDGGYRERGGGDRGFRGRRGGDDGGFRRGRGADDSGYRGGRGGGFNRGHGEDGEGFRPRGGFNARGRGNGRFNREENENQGYSSRGSFGPRRGFREHDEEYTNNEQESYQGKRTVFNDDEHNDTEIEEVEKEHMHDQNQETAEQKTQVKKKFEKKTAKEYHKDAALKAWRMIVRNLPFKTSAADLQNVCSKFGPFTDITLPPSKKIPNKIAGFAFIQFQKKEDAQKAFEHFNSNQFLGRSVAADWALPKDTFVTAAHEEKEDLKKKVKIEKEESESESDGEESDEDSNDEEDEKMDTDEGDNEDKPKKARKSDSAVEEKRVVFLRNISFDTTEETLKEVMEKFGKVELSILCKFADSGHSKGTAFVHFATPEEANACVVAGYEGSLEIDGRQISTALAIEREKASMIDKEKFTKIPADKRNLRLLRFGLIREGSSNAKGMSSEDAAKRVRLAEANRKKLENLHMFVSPNRLMIHNLPRSMTDESLRKICREATDSTAHISECRIWMDMNKLDAKSRPTSKGFAFVAFSEHKDALKCLEKLNNNPNTFTNEKRPIVEFSIENITALQSKERRVANSKGEKVTGKQISEKVKKQVRESIGVIHAAGMKPLPKFLGKKVRHRDQTKKMKKKNPKSKDGNNKNKDIAKTAGGGVSKAGKKSGKKTTTKYLALST